VLLAVAEAAPEASEPRPGPDVEALRDGPDVVDGEADGPGTVFFDPAGAATEPDPPAGAPPSGARRAALPTAAVAWLRAFGALSARPSRHKTATATPVAKLPGIVGRAGTNKSATDAEPVR
jgi:hypothetical protein